MSGVSWTGLNYLDLQKSVKDISCYFTSNDDIEGYTYSVIMINICHLINYYLSLESKNGLILASQRKLNGNLYDVNFQVLKASIILESLGCKGTPPSKTLLRHPSTLVLSRKPEQWSSELGK